MRYTNLRFTYLVSNRWLIAAETFAPNCNQKRDLNFSVFSHQVHAIEAYK